MSESKSRSQHFHLCFIQGTQNKGDFLNKETLVSAAYLWRNLQPKAVGGLYPWLLQFGGPQVVCIQYGPYFTFFLIKYVINGLGSLITGAD